MFGNFQKRGSSDVDDDVDVDVDDDDDDDDAVTWEIKPGESTAKSKRTWRQTAKYERSIENS